VGEGKVCGTGGGAKQQRIMKEQQAGTKKGLEWKTEAPGRDFFSEGNLWERQGIPYTRGDDKNEEARGLGGGGVTEDWVPWGKKKFWQRKARLEEVIFRSVPEGAAGVETQKPLQVSKRGKTRERKIRYQARLKETTTVWRMSGV